MSQEATKAKSGCDDLKEQIEQAQAKAGELRDELYSKGMENLYREWFEK